MYVRSKIVKGRTYFQIVEGHRDGERVRQRVVLYLGQIADPRKALEQWRGRLRSLQRWRDRVAPPDELGLVSPHIQRADAEISKLKDKIKELGALIKYKLIGTTEKARGRMVRDVSDCGIRFFALEGGSSRRRKAKK
jgi:hypothetical protein